MSAFERVLLLLCMMFGEDERFSPRVNGMLLIIRHKL